MSVRKVTFEDRVNALVGQAEQEEHEPPKRDRKAQWIPGIEWKGDEGEVTTLPMEGEVAWRTESSVERKSSSYPRCKNGLQLRYLKRRNQKT